MYGNIVVVTGEKPPGEMNERKKPPRRREKKSPGKDGGLSQRPMESESE